MKGGLCRISGAQASEVRPEHTLHAWNLKPCSRGHVGASRSTHSLRDLKTQGIARGCRKRHTTNPEDSVVESHSNGSWHATAALSFRGARERPSSTSSSRVAVGYRFQGTCTLRRQCEREIREQAICGITGGQRESWHGPRRAGSHWEGGKESRQERVHQKPVRARPWRK